MIHLPIYQVRNPRQLILLTFPHPNIFSYDRDLLIQPPLQYDTSIFWLLPQTSAYDLNNYNRGPFFILLPSVLPSLFYSPQCYQIELSKMQNKYYHSPVKNPSLNPDTKRHILQNPIHIKVQNRQVHRDRKEISGCQGLEVRHRK